MFCLCRFIDRPFWMFWPSNVYKNFWLHKSLLIKESLDWIMEPMMVTFVAYTVNAMYTQMHFKMRGRQTFTNFKKCCASNYVLYIQITYPAVNPHNDSMHDKNIEKLWLMQKSESYFKKIIWRERFAALRQSTCTKNLRW